MKTKRPENPEFARAVGKSTLLRIDWKNWKKEVPTSGQDIWVIIRLQDGYYPVMGTYFDEVIPASKDGHFPESRWRSVRFQDFGLPDIYIGNKEAKRLVAWGVNRSIVRLGKDCKKCKRLECSCERKSRH